MGTQTFSASVAYVKPIKDERIKPLVNGKPQERWNGSRHDGELLELKRIDQGGKPQSRSHRPIMQRQVVQYFRGHNPFW
jgi:hypothetical protein